MPNPICTDFVASDHPAVSAFLWTDQVPAASCCVYPAESVYFESDRNGDEPVGFPVELHSDDNMDGPWPRNMIFSVDYWTTIILMIFVFSSLCCHKRLVFWKWILTAFMALTPCYVLVVVVSINAVVVDGAYIVIYTVYIPSSHWIHSDCLCGVT